MKRGPYKPLEAEKQIAEFWEKGGIFRKYMENRKGRKKYYFMDGPPYATGSIHLGTALNKVLKDFFIRFFSATGYDVSMQPGYDTHGLPIENKIEKQLGFRTKADIEQFGVEKFNGECRKFATKYIEIMNAQFKNLGVWMDWDRPYLTLDKSYIEGAWYTFKRGFENNLLYRGEYPVHVCPHCVDPNSTILVDGGSRKIKELKNCWKHNKVVSFDTGSKKLCITKPLGYMEHEEDAFMVKTRTGKKIVASSDHPFWTKQGWTPLISLIKGTEVATYNPAESKLPLIAEKGKPLANRNDIKKTIENFETAHGSSKPRRFNDSKSGAKIEIKNYVHGLRNRGYSYNRILKQVKNKFKTTVSKSWVSKILNTDTSTRYDIAIKDLEKRGIIPLNSKSEKAFVLARLVGHIFGDGSLLTKFTPNRRFPIFTLVFTGKENDLQEIQKDLDTLGYSYTPIRKVKTESMVNDRAINGFTTSMRCYSSSLALLLVSLGAPVGRKTECNTSVPAWTSYNKKLAREFLAAYFGSELDIIKPTKYGKGFETLRLHMTKARKLEKNGVEFAKNICRLVKYFGVTTGGLRVDRNTVNGKRKSKITISIDCNDGNIMKFAKFLGYEYCKERKIRASYSLGYLQYKKEKEKELDKIKNNVMKLKNNLVSCRKIAHDLRLSEFYVSHVIHGKSKHSRAAKYIPTFHVWLQDKSKDLKDGLVWDEIKDIKPMGRRDVCDIAVETHHNFIVNNFLAHNCETVVAFNEIEHKEVQDNSIYVKFKLKNRSEHLLVWTTTPWTLPANTGIMVDPEADYEAVNLGKDVLVVAKELEEKVMRIGKVEHCTIERTLKGKDMVGWEYENPLKDLPLQKNVRGVVVPSEQFVSLDDGTGLVHLAPGHGKEDYLVGIKFNLPVLSPVTIGGKFKNEAGWLEGKFVKDADKEIIAKLSELGALFAVEQTTHEYPKCWRCSSSLLFLTVPQWFFRVSAIREKLIEENKNVNWVPRFASDNFESWLMALSDWPISRQRYWGIPLPIWVCEKCDSIRVIGSSEELGVEINDLHRPCIDEVFLKCGCGNRMRRIPDVLDVWFDSGVSSWASIGFPKSREEFDKKWPADLNIEGPDQFRGWWNSQMITSVITFGQKPFKNVLLHGKVLDMKGAKMSKSKGNITTPEEVVEKYGRDALRLYLLGLPLGEDFSFNTEQVRESLNILNTLWNSFSFLESYCSRVNAPEKLEFEDLWIISRINSVLSSCRKNGGEYNVSEYVRIIRGFILKDLSRWYIRLVRERTWPSYSGEDKNAAFYTIYYVFDRLVKILAPVCPFISEVIYQAMNPPKKSVHLEDLPESDSAAISGGTERSMEGAREIVEALNSLRQENSLRLRWPLRGAAVIGMEHSKTAKAVIERAANVKEILFSGHAKGAVHKDLSNGKAFLDVSMDEPLIEESMIMELIRKIQTMRKEKQLDVRDDIVLFIKADQKTEKSVEAWEDTVKKAVGAARIEFAGHEHAETLDFEGAKINVGFDVVRP